MNFSTGYAKVKKFNFGGFGAVIEIQMPTPEQALEMQAIGTDESLNDEQKLAKINEKYTEIIKSWNLEQDGQKIKCNKKNKILLLQTAPFKKFLMDKIGNLAEWETKEQLQFDLVAKN